MNIKLRAVEPSDLDLLYEAENEQDLWYLGSTHAPFSRYQLEQYILSARASDIYTDRQLRLMIDYEEDGAQFTAGMVDLYDFEPQHLRAGVGILLMPQYRHKGIAGKALQELICYAFDILHLHQLYCEIPVNNEQSLNLFKKQGFEITGTKKEWLCVKGSPIDVYFLQLLKG